MAIVEQMVVSSARAVFRPFRRVLITAFGGLMLWLVLSKIIIRTINTHPSERFVVAFNITGYIVIGTAVLYVGVISPLLAISAPWRARRRARRSESKPECPGLRTIGIDLTPSARHRRDRRSG